MTMLTEYANEYFDGEIARLLAVATTTLDSLRKRPTLHASMDLVDNATWLSVRVAQRTALQEFALEHAEEGGNAK